MRKKVRNAVIIVVIVLLPIAWYLGSPLFIDTVVDEEFPLELGQQISEQDDAVSEFNRNVIELLGDMTEEDAEALTPEQEKELKQQLAQMLETVPTGPELIAEGQFVDGDELHKGSGTASIYAVPNGESILRFEEFSVTNGPALRVYLVKNPSGELDQGFIDLGALKGNMGNQNYQIPADTDLSQYGSVVIYCKPFKVIFAVASLF